MVLNGYSGVSVDSIDIVTPVGKSINIHIAMNHSILPKMEIST